jgi:hypothetical protein
MCLFDCVFVCSCAWRERKKRETGVTGKEKKVFVPVSVDVAVLAPAPAPAPVLPPAIPVL